MPPTKTNAPLPSIALLSHHQNKIDQSSRSRTNALTSGNQLQIQSIILFRTTPLAGEQCDTLGLLRLNERIKKQRRYNLQIILTLHALHLLSHFYNVGLESSSIGCLHLLIIPSLIPSRCFRLMVYIETVRISFIQSCESGV